MKVIHWMKAGAENGMFHLSWCRSVLSEIFHFSHDSGDQTAQDWLRASRRHAEADQALLVALLRVWTVAPVPIQNPHPMNQYVGFDGETRHRAFRIFCLHSPKTPPMRPFNGREDMKGRTFSGLRSSPWSGGYLERSKRCESKDC